MIHAYDSGRAATAADPSQAPSSDRRGIAARVVRVTLVAGALPIAVALTAARVFGDTRHVHLPLHEALELAGAFIAVAVAALLLLRQSSAGDGPPLFWMVAGLVAMALVDAVHSQLPMGAAFSWTRHSATLLGGLISALIWLAEPAALVRRRYLAITAVALAALSLALAICRWPSLFPAPWIAGNYSPSVIVANAMGGLGFLTAAAYFERRYRREQSAEDLAFFGLTLLFAVAAIMFGVSDVWAADWWAWHAFRLIAYAVLLLVAYQVLATLFASTRQRADDAVRHLVAMVESSDDAIIGKAKDGTILSWNRGAERLYGYPAAEIVGKSIRLLARPEDQVQIDAILDRVAAGERVLHFEAQRLRKDGTEVSVSVNVSPIVDMAGNVIGASTIARDITQAKQAEAVIRLSEERFRTLVTATAQIVWTMSSDGLVVADLPDWRGFTGQSPEAIRGTGWAEAVHPDDRERSLRVWSAAVAARTPYDIEYRIRRHDGQYRWFAVRGVPLLADDGTVREWIGTCNDIHERQQSAVALSEAQRIAHLGSWDLDFATDEVRWTDEVFRIFGLPHRNGAFPNAQARAMTLAEDQPGFNEAFRAARAGEKPFEAEHRIRRPDGTIRFLRCAAEIRRDDAGRPVRAVGTVLDITDLKEAQQALVETNRELEQRVRERTTALQAANDELAAFAYSVSHDLRAPLRSMNGFARALQEDFAPVLDATGRDYLERIRRASDSMSRLIDDMLKLSRLTRTELRYEPIDLTALAWSIVEALRSGAQERQVDVSVADGLTCRGDPTLIRILLENLLDNAWKFSGRHPRARIAVGSEPTPSGPAFFVRDDGAGFDMLYVDKLFQPFQRLHAPADFPGTGIGLATVRRIASRHGGRAWASGQVEAGAIIWFTLA